MPRGMIVTLWIGSACGSRTPSSAWPASCTAVTFFSSSLMIIERRSAPISTLSLANSKSSIETTFRLLARGVERRLVHEVGQVGAGEARPCRAPAR